MSPLPRELRKDLEKAVIDAREVAERGARAALQVLAVDSDRAFDTMSAEDRGERNALRARMRSLASADNEDAGGPRGFGPLIEGVAYEQWHRMLFARFLAENNLLIHPEHGVAVSLEDCVELAAAAGETDEWVVAARFAGEMLPGIFRRDDPAVKVRFAPNDRQALEAILNSLPSELFHADDALGWVYQFWQTKAKDEVNKSGRKVGGRDLAPVTQLFTEHYMVQFLLENSLGAWWAARHADSPIVKEWEYLRFRDDGTPAAGTFPGWPETAAEVTVMDPCCGSGHFLVAAGEMLRKMRMEEDGLGPGQAAGAVLCDNLFGLELDPRCTQLAAFALVFDAWKAGLDTKEPVLPNVACSGIAVSGQLEDWKRLAGDDANLQYTLERLYALFKDAPDLGSLINPAAASPQEQLFTSSYEEIGPVLQQALAAGGDEDPVAAVFGAAAEGVERAGMLLASQYTLVATNVPYLARGKQSQELREFIESVHPDAKTDLATAFVERCQSFTSHRGSYAMVTPLNWLFLTSYKKLRIRMLKTQIWNHVSRLGPGAFETIGGEVVNVALLVLTNAMPEADERAMTGIDAASVDGPSEKSLLLASGDLAVLEQKRQLDNPDSRILLVEIPSGPLLERYADSLQGVSPADFPHYGRCFWEIDVRKKEWRFWQSTVQDTTSYGGREHALWWNDDLMDAVESGHAYVRGEAGWGKNGVAVAQMSGLSATIYTGEPADTNVAVIVPERGSELLAIWAYCSSEEFPEMVRMIDTKMNVTNATLAKVPFDLEHWQKVAEEKYPDGLPEPHSDDPTQWLFKGNVVDSEAPLDVAVARLLGYRWPDQPADDLDSHADGDGIVCIPALARERDAEERLRALLAEAYGDAWSPSLLDRLMDQVAYKGKSLEQWLRDKFFEQHCKLFHRRPFIWQVWDGRRDGFSALVNYHMLDNARLQKLAYTYLGAWIDRQKDEVNRGVGGAEDRLAAAQELQANLALILKGEPPYDIYVRWKELHEQAIGWNPDLDDGVRMNIRPFMEAGVLRWKPNIKWGKDRGKNPDGSERLNDLHYTIEQKQDARAKAGVPA